MLLLPLAAAAAFAADALPAGAYEGQCFYPEAVLRRAVADTLVACNQAAVEEGGIVFASRSWGDQMRFDGEFQGDRLTVQRVTLRNGTTAEARGVCQIYYANDRVSTIACTAMVRSRSYAANFVVSRLNPGAG